MFFKKKPVEKSKVAQAVFQSKKRLFKGAICVALAAIVNLLETWYFGWHRLPVSLYEYAWDFGCMFLMIYGWYLIVGAKIIVKIDLSELSDFQFDTITETLQKDGWK